MADDRRGDSPLVFVIIRGALWGIVGAVVGVVMTEILGLLATGGMSLGIPTFAGGVPALAIGLLSGVVVAVVAYSVLKRKEAEAQQAILGRVVGLTAGILTLAVAMGALLWFQADTGFMFAPLHWLLSIGMILLGICVPVAGFAIWAAGKTYRGYRLRFSDD